MPKLIFLAFFGCFVTFVICGRTEIFTNRNKYLPTWESLDSRPLPQWYDDAKFGIFFHWGVYSVPGFGSEWFWSNWNISEPNIENFMKERFPPGFTYQQFAPDFTAEFFNATRWADIIFKSNAKYVVLTSKHHEGFTLWPSSRAFSWNAKDVGPHRDIVEELSTAVRKRKLVFGVYYSLYEWFNPIYLADKMSNFTKRNYVTEKMLPELNELIHNYKPEIIWSDGDWEASEDYFKSKDFLAWLYNESPVKDTVIANDRWGRDIPCHHGDVYTCTDRYNPGVLQNHKWENCMTVDKKSWGFRRNAELSDYKTVHELITDLSSTVSCGGNLLMNIGPTRDGMIAPIFQDRLEGIGKWLDVNGEAIFKTTPWVYQNDTIDGQVWYTSKPIKNSQKNRVVYAIVLKWPKDNVLNLGALSQRLKIGKSVIVILGNDNAKLQWQEKDDSVQITFPDMASLKSQIAWSLKITNIVSTSENF